MSELEGKTMLCAASKDDACRYYRMTVPAEELRDSRVIWSEETSGQTTLLWDDYLSLRALIVQRPVNDSVRRLVSRTVAVKGKRPRVVIEIDDDLWAIPTHNPAYDYYHTKDRLSNLEYCVSVADRIIVSTSILADVVKARTGRGCVIVPNTLPTGLEWAGLEGAGHEGILFSGGQTHAEDVREPFSSLKGDVRQGKIKALLLGHDYRDLLPRAQWVDWTHDMAAHYARLPKYSGWVGLAPLVRDTFNESKSAIRLMEYALGGILPVVTPYGPYAGREGVVEVGPHEQWRRAVRRALGMSDEEKRQRVEALRSWAKTRVITEVLDEWRNAWYLVE